MAIASHLTTFKHCKSCGSQNIRLDAWASWNTFGQYWVLSEFYDAAYCIDCDGSTTIVDVEIDLTKSRKDGR